MAYLAGWKWNTGYLDTLYNHASDPDTWGPLQMVQHYSWGGAGDKCKLFADSARTKIKSQNPDMVGGYTDLSVSMHYMSDVANPWHTKPLEYQLRHSAYEQYVADNWAGGVTYWNDVYNDWYYYVSDPKASADNLAAVSTQYFSYLDSKIAQGGDWGNLRLLKRSVVY